MKQLLVVIIAFFQFNLILAQDIKYSNYDWESMPKFPKTDTIKAENGVIFLLERKINEVYSNKDQIFEELSIYHRQVKVLTTDALAGYNRFYIQLEDVLEIVQIKARFIKKDGKIVELPKESIKEVENLENKGNYKAFAIEGAEVGGIIEYFYILKKVFTAHAAFYAQSAVTKLNFEALYTYPVKLEYYFKTYNGLPPFEEIKSKVENKDLDKNEKTTMAIKVPYIAPLEEEKYSAPDANLMRFEYTLAYNKYNSVLRVYSWSKASNFVWNNLYDLSNDESKAIENYLKKMPLNGLDIRKKIRAIEDKVKTGITLSKEVPSSLTLDKIIELKQAHSRGITKLLLNLYLKAGINNELVITTDRLKRNFDPEFNGMNFLDEYLLYFPDIDEYTLPDELQFRLGVVNDNFTGNYGIFFHPLKYNEDLQTLAYDIRFIPYSDYLKNADSLNINLKIDVEKLQLEVKTRRAFTGNLAQGFQANWEFIPADRKTEAVNSIFNMGSDNNQLVSFEVKGSSQSDIGINPFIWNVVQIAPSLIEKADNDIIVKIGEVIGEQSQLYREKPRKLPVDVNNMMHYRREINLTIPDGYKITNPDEMNMKVEMVNNNMVSCAFTSEYTLKGNQLKVIVHEYYKEQSYPLSRFEEFRAVINAAADFNKKTVILTKI